MLKFTKKEEIMKNFNGFLYHIVRYQKLEVGDKLTFGNTPNKFSEKIFEASFQVGELDVNQLVHSKPFKEFSGEEEKETKRYIYESCQMLRELILEKVRKEEFSKRPSRLECIYCTKSFEEAKQWIPALKRMHPSQPPLQIVKLKAKGNVFEGDGNLMLRNTFSLNAKIEMARQYWSGSNNPKLSEVLFVGKAEVVEILEEF